MRWIWMIRASQRVLLKTFHKYITCYNNVMIWNKNNVCNVIKITLVNKLFQRNFKKLEEIKKIFKTSIIHKHQYYQYRYCKWGFISKGVARRKKGARLSNRNGPLKETPYSPKPKQGFELEKHIFDRWHLLTSSYVWHIQSFPFTDRISFGFFIMVIEKLHV